MTYNGKYKCRLCGKTYKHCMTGDKDIVLQSMFYVTDSILKDVEKLPIQHPEKHSIHFCDNGSFGVADFIGFEVE